MTFSDVIEANRPKLDEYEKIYKALHQLPELSCHEANTAAKVSDCLKKSNDYEIYRNIGGHGLAAVLKNGPGKTVLLRADMDALPLDEKTGLPYASKNPGVMHACGHDHHVAALLAAAQLLLNAKDSDWAGTLILVFQPAEEKGGGAMKMIDDGLYQKVPIPDVVFAQHVIPNRAGTIGTRPGTILAASAGMKVTVYGHGGHGSTPNRTVDPVVLASSIVMRLQTIVSREIDPSDFCVITVGSIHAGDAHNVIPDTANLLISMRTIDAQIETKAKDAIKRIINAECKASLSPQDPDIVEFDAYPATFNNEKIFTLLKEPFHEHFGEEFDPDIPRANGSEDFSTLGISQQKPCFFWFYGGTDRDQWDEAERNGTLETAIPVNHSPHFAPAIQPTMQVGCDALALAALTFFQRA
jgi:amidohydrolase